MIELHIEELVLVGFAAGDRDRIAAALERELGARLAAGGLGQGLMDRGGADRIEGGTFTLAPGARADTIGTRAARAVHKGLIR